MAEGQSAIFIFNLLNLEYIIFFNLYDIKITSQIVHQLER